MISVLYMNDGICERMRKEKENHHTNYINIPVSELDLC